MLERAYFQLRAEARASIDFTLLLLEQPNWFNLIAPVEIAYQISAGGEDSIFARFILDNIR